MKFGSTYRTRRTPISDDITENTAKSSTYLEMMLEGKQETSGILSFIELS